MADVSTIAEALRSVVDTNLTVVDKSSVDGYTPALDTQSIALMVVPFRQQDVFNWADLSGTKLEVIHAIQLQFWIKLPNDPTGIAAAMQRGRDIGLQAAKVIAANDGASYQLEPDAPLMQNEVDENIWDVSGIPFIRAWLTVRVRNEVALA